MARDQDVKALQGIRIAVGLSAVIGVTAVAGQNWAQVKYFSGGTCEIGGASLTWGAGYLMGALEVIQIPISGRFFLVSAGATSLVHVILGKDQGYEE